MGLSTLPMINVLYYIGGVKEVYLSSYCLISHEIEGYNLCGGEVVWQRGHAHRHTCIQYVELKQIVCVLGIYICVSSKIDVKVITYVDIIDCLNLRMDIKNFLSRNNVMSFVCVLYSKRLNSARPVSA